MDIDPRFYKNNPRDITLLAEILAELRAIVTILKEQEKQ